MHYSLAYQLGERSGALDPDAKAYIAAVETAGATVTSGQKKAINTFVKTGKSDGWYSSIKRLYLPIWASAAPNAVDMITRASGTFTASGVDHSNVGYVVGDGISGYFNSGSSPVDLGIALESAHILLLGISNPATGSFCGYRGSGTQRFICGDGGANNITSIGSTASQIVASNADPIAILLASRIADDNLALYKRKSGGFSTLGTNTNTETTALLDLDLYFAGAWNNNGNPQFQTPMNQGAYGFGEGLTQTQAEDFSLALKDLWETASGLTLP